MNVAELIEFLKTQPQDMLVVYDVCSEYCLVEAEGIKVKNLCVARPDGWVHRARPDKPTVPYLVLSDY